MNETEKLFNEIIGLQDGFLYAMYTDRIVLESWPLSEEMRIDLCAGESRLLEMRVFDARKEYKLFRSDIGKPFLRRLIDDEAEQREYYVEEQYLDIDEERSGELFKKTGDVSATGGGRYHLPTADYRNAKLRIHNYIDYYAESGQAYVRDWRLAGIFNEERRRM